MQLTNLRNFWLPEVSISFDDYLCVILAGFDEVHRVLLDNRLPMLLIPREYNKLLQREKGVSSTLWNVFFYEILVSNSRFGTSDAETSNAIALLKTIKHQFCGLVGKLR